MKMKWDEIGERLYETGTKRGVVYPQVGNAYPKGYAWNGLTAFTMSPDGADVTDLYADDIKYVSLRSRENFKATIEAYTYPDEFAACDGSATVDGVPGVYLGQQPRKAFGFSCVTSIGNDTEFEEHGYKLHLVWGATAAPSERSYETQSDDPEAITFSWEIDCLPVNVTGFKPVAHMEIDSTKADPAKLAALEAILYGTDATGTEGEDGYVAGTDARLPLPDEILALMAAA